MKKYGFTLAEVLITLGIIGIVAAMTLPTLIAKNQEKVLETQRKKAASVLANGYKMMLAKNEVFNIFETPMANCLGSANALDCFNNEHKSVFNIIKSGLLADINLSLSDKYYDVNNKELTSLWKDDWYVFVTPDGFIYGVDAAEMFNNKNLNVYVDVNGIKNPNTAGQDLVLFKVSQSASVTEVTLEASDCSLENLSACSDEAACYSIESAPDANGRWHCPYWNGQSCTDSCPK